MQLNNRNILITGGAGYIGSHTVKALAPTGANLIILDNLSTGFAESVVAGPLIEGDIANEDLVANILQKHHITDILHFAAKTSVPESLADPVGFYECNVVGSLKLIKQAIKYGVQNFIFSSTAAVYGPTSESKVTESHPCNPMSPYGRSKLMVEQALQDMCQANKMNWLILRYFNVAGCDPEGQIGQLNPNAKHLIKMAIQASLDQNKTLEIFGNDYDTPDGTCIRDFIHVTDLADAHCHALDYLLQGGDNQIFNCGYGTGFSVQQVIDTLNELSEKLITVKQAPRREGDIEMMVADPTKIHSAMAWQPHYQNLSTIIQSALDWERKAKPYHCS